MEDNDPLNRKIAITVALLASFMGICKVKDDNIGWSACRFIRTG